MSPPKGSSSKSASGSKASASRGSSSKGQQQQRRTLTSTDDRDDRQRVAQACDRCRLKKIKCDGSIPCNRCRAEDAVCYFGCRRKDEERTVPFAYVSQLESQQRILVASLKAMWKRYCAPGRLVDDNDVPPIHRIVEELGILDDSGLDQILGLEQSEPGSASSYPASDSQPETSQFGQSSVASTTSEYDPEAFQSNSLSSSALLPQSPGLSNTMQYFSVDDNAFVASPETLQAQGRSGLEVQQMVQWAQYQRSGDPLPAMTAAMTSATSEELAEENWYAWINENGC